MPMGLRVIGSGAAVINLERKGACYALETGGKLVLMDCGWGCPENLLRAGYRIEDIDHILITHPHADHMGSLMNLLQSMLVAGYDISGPGYESRARSKPLCLHGYKGFARDYDDLRRIMFPDREEKYAIKIIEYADTVAKFDGMTISSRLVKHDPEHFNAVSYRIDSGEGSVVYSGDCGFGEPLVELAKGADVALFEVSVPPAMYAKGPRPNHLSPYECGIIASRAGVGKLVLTHLYGNATDEEMIAEARKSYGGDVSVARDLMAVSWPAERQETRT